MCGSGGEASNLIYLQLRHASECLQELDNHLIKCTILLHAPIMQRTNYIQCVLRALLAQPLPLTGAKSGGPAITQEKAMHMVILS